MADHEPEPSTDCGENEGSGHTDRSGQDAVCTWREDEQDRGEGVEGPAVRANDIPVQNTIMASTPSSGWSG